MRNTTLLTKLLVSCMAAGLALLMTACLSSGQGSVLSEMNADRSSNGRRALPSHATLDAKAQRWAEKLARDNALSHSTLTDGAPGCWESLGENVGYGPSVPSIQDAYMHSAGHRANILNTRWDYVGVGHARRGERTFTVQVFMKGCR